MSTRIVTVDLDVRSYEVFIGHGLLYRMVDFLPDEIEGNSFFIIADTNVEHYARRVSNILNEAGAFKAPVFTLNPGEGRKNISTCETIINWLLDQNVSRDATLIGVGGGVVGDITGFCASVTLRGLSYIQIPTTLLAQVDSSVGGKTGVNARQGKNMIGTFYQPRAVIIDLETLETLPERELLAGYAEVVKYGLIRDIGFFNWLDQNAQNVIALEEEALAQAVEASVKAKAGIVEADEREEDNLRALLNLGHSFGHALETAAGYDGRLLHGEAVAIGMVMAFDLSSRMKLCARTDLQRVEQHLIGVGLPTRASFVQPPIDTTPDKLFEIMQLDKKNRAGAMRLILVNGIGEAFVSEEAPGNMIRDVLAESLGGEEEQGSGGQARRRRKEGLWTRVFSSHS